jgi:hypothetical protein
VELEGEKSKMSHRKKVKKVGTHPWRNVQTRIQATRVSWAGLVTQPKDILTRLTRSDTALTRIGAAPAQHD